MYEKYIEIINANGGIITSKDANKNGISRTILSKMVKNKSIERIDYGIYVTDEFICDELFIFQMKHPNTVFSFNTALYLLNKTERTPEKFDITTTRNNSLGYCKDIANIHRVNNMIKNYKSLMDRERNTANKKLPPAAITFCITLTKSRFQGKISFHEHLIIVLDIHN